MKNYLLLLTKNPQGKIEASLHSKETTSASEQLTYDIVMSSSKEFIDAEFMDANTLYFVQADSIDQDFERTMRLVGFRRCDRCGKWIAPQDLETQSVYLGNDERLCKVCYEAEYKNLQEVKCYHGSGNYIRLLKQDDEDITIDNISETNILTCGIEMEAENPQTNFIRDLKIKTTDRFYKENTKGRTKYRLFRLEKDCSLPKGVEFISNIMTKKFAEDFDWSILTDQMKFLGAKDDNPNTGFHIHIGKQALGADAYEQAMNCLKLTYFMSIYQADFLKISGRKPDQMYYCSFPTEEKIMQIKNGIIRAQETQSDPFTNQTYSMNHGQSGCAFISSGKTVELRIFKSTSDAEKIKHTMALILNIAENIKNVPFEKIYCFRKMFKTVPEETMNYWRNKGCFLHTYASVKKGETL